MPIFFTIPGEPKGYVSGAKFWSKKTAPSRNYSRLVREEAKKYISLPLTADKKSPLYIDTVAFFSSGCHCDPENVHKLVKDSFFYIEKDSNALAKKRRGNDKWTGGIYQIPLYDKENPRVEVAIYTPNEVEMIRMRAVEKCQVNLKVK